MKSKMVDKEIKKKPKQNGLTTPSVSASKFLRKHLTHFI